MRQLAMTVTACSILLTIALVAGEGGPASRPASSPPKKGSNLDYWLNQAKPAETQSAAEANAPAPGVNPFDTNNNFAREDALPGVLELSNGQVQPGWMFTTREKVWELWVEKPSQIVYAGEGHNGDPSQPFWKRIHRIPFLAVLSITAVIDSQDMVQQWRWEGMGVPLKTYTGESFPERRMKWKFHLIDGTYMTGDIKGQPIWVQTAEQKYGPFVLSETTRGELGQSMADFLYISRIIVSRRLMDAVTAELKSNPARNRPFVTSLPADKGPPTPPSQPAAPKRTGIQKK